MLLTDSHAILMYLCDKYVPNNDLFPQEIILRSKIINRLMFNATVLFRRDSDYMVSYYELNFVIKLIRKPFFFYRKQYLLLK